MPKGLLFFCCACCILLLTIVNLSIGPIISGTIGSTWGTLNCVEEKDNYDKQKELNKNMSKEDKKYIYEWRINRCQRRKAMHDMEYTAFIFDIVIGFVCGLLGLFHFFGIKTEGTYVEKTGLIGLICGCVGFILTFVYIVLNGIVYTNDYSTSSLYKTDGEGAYAKLVESGKYECMYFDKKGNTHALIAKYSDYIKKQYNYNKDLKDEFSPGTKGILEKRACLGPNPVCDDNGYMTYSQTYESGKDCKYLYLDQTSSSIWYKDVSDRFLTTLILGLIVCLANIGLALFGFLMAKSGELN